MVLLEFHDRTIDDIAAGVETNMPSNICEYLRESESSQIIFIPVIVATAASATIDHAIHCLGTVTAGSAKLSRQQTILIQCISTGPFSLIHTVPGSARMARQFRGLGHISILTPDSTFRKLLIHSLHTKGPTGLATMIVPTFPSPHNEPHRSLGQSVNVALPFLFSI